MDSKKLNQLLIIEFPELLDTYQEEIAWQEGNETGSHIIYGDVFYPYIERSISEKNVNAIKHIFEFIEKTLNSNDQYSKEVIAFSILERLCDNRKSLNWTKRYMGDKTIEIIQSIKKYIEN